MRVRVRMRMRMRMRMRVRVRVKEVFITLSLWWIYKTIHEISILSVLTVCEYHDNSSVMIYRINE